LHNLVGATELPPVEYFFLGGDIGPESKGTNSTDKTFNCLHGFVEFMGAPRVWREGNKEGRVGEREAVILTTSGKAVEGKSTFFYAVFSFICYSYISANIFFALFPDILKIQLRWYIPLKNLPIYVSEFANNALYYLLPLCLPRLQVLR
jgi:hypothetical protein